MYKTTACFLSLSPFLWIAGLFVTIFFNSESNCEYLWYKIMNK